MPDNRRLWIWDSLGSTHSYYETPEFESFQARLQDNGWKVELKHCKQQVENECVVATLQNAEALMVGATLGLVDWNNRDWKLEKLQNVMANAGARRLLAGFLEHMRPRCENWFDVVMGRNPSGYFWNLTLLKKMPCNSLFTNMLGRGKKPSL